MVENIFATLGLSGLGSLSIMAFLTLILVEDLKQIVPKKFPTQLLTLIVALIIAIIIPIVGGTFNLVSIVTSILNGFVVAFISMYGFDQLKSIWKRVNKTEEENNGD